MTVRRVLDNHYRANRSPEVELALLDFLDLTTQEQQEFLLCCMLELTANIQYIRQRLDMDK